MNYNKVILSGRICNDLEPRKTTSGSSVLSIRLAVNNYYKKDGEKHEEANFFNCILFNRLADIAADYCQKGQNVLVDGKLQIREYKDREGIKKYMTEIIVDNFQMGVKPAGNNPQQQERQDPISYYEELKKKQSKTIEKDDVKLEDIPF